MVCGVPQPQKNPMLTHFNPEIRLNHSTLDIMIIYIVCKHKSILRWWLRYENACQLEIGGCRCRNVTLALLLVFVRL